MPDTEFITPADLETMALSIAKRHFPTAQTLDTQKSDGLDFHDVAVWSIRAALIDAFQAGMDATLNGKR